MEPDDLSVLAQRAASEGPRWTRAREDPSAPIPRERHKIRDVKLRSTAAVGTAWVPFFEVAYRINSKWRIRSVEKFSALNARTRLSGW